MRDRYRPAGDANPFEGFLLLAALAQGATVLTGVAAPTSVIAALPPGLVVLWAVLLLAGGGLALAGLYWLGDPFLGVEIKRVGLIGAAVGALVYASAASLLGASGVAVAIYNMLFAVACIVRVFQVSRRLRWAREHMTESRGPTGG